MQLQAPGKRILLHVCCAPCSGAVIEALCRQGLETVVFWSNGNICTAEENRRRLDTLLPYAAKFGVRVVEDAYDHEAWRAFVCGRLGERSAAGLASYPERGARCLECFRFRLQRAAAYAAANGFDCLATSLASSRWQSLEQVEEAGRWAVASCHSERSEESPPSCHSERSEESPPSCHSERSEESPSLTFWPQNWRKGGLQPRRQEIIREEGFYNQTFCGCEYSLNYK